MIRSVMEGSGSAVFAIVGLVIFVAVFIGLTVWVLTRRQKQVDKWSNIPLHDEPIDPRNPEPTDHETQADDPEADGPGRSTT